MGIASETCKVQLPSGPTDFRTTIVKPYFEKPEQETGTGRIEEVRDEADEEDNNMEGDEGTERRPQRNRRIPTRYLNVTDANIAIYMAQPTYTDSRQKEINGLLEKGVFEVIDITTIPQGKRVFNSRFVDEIKNKGTDLAFEKSRLVVQAYNDDKKELVLTQSPTIQRSSQRLILAMAPALFKNSTTLYLRDISQAYVQSTSLLNRDFYIKPPHEVNELLQLEKTSILKVIKPLYSIPEAGNHWFSTYQRHHINKLKMTESTYDPCLLYSNIDTDGFGLVGLQTDDTLFLTDQAFAIAEERELKSTNFIVKEHQELTIYTPIKFNGGHINLNSDGSIEFNQVRQCENLKLVNIKNLDLISSRGNVRKAVTPKDQYVAQHTRGAYIASVYQPESAFDLSFTAQVINPKEDDAKRLNKRLQWQMENKNRGLRFVPLDLTTLKLIVFTDASFTNNKDNTSQIGFIIILADSDNRANIIH